MTRHRNQSTNAQRTNAPLGIIRGLKSVKPTLEDAESEPTMIPKRNGHTPSGIPAWARRSLKFGRVNGSEPCAVLNPMSTTPITIPAHTRIWICPEGEARGHFEVYWDQQRRELVIKTHPGTFAIKPHCANGITIRTEEQ